VKAGAIFINKSSVKIIVIEQGIKGMLYLHDGAMGGIVLERIEASAISVSIQDVLHMLDCIQGVTGLCGSFGTLSRISKLLIFGVVEGERRAEYERKPQINTSLELVILSYLNVNVIRR
jgi:hypothetical protein